MRFTWPDSPATSVLPINVASEPDLQLAYRRYFPLIREKCRRILPDPEEAQDVAQETFIRLWSTRLQDQDPRRMTAWIYRTATRLAIDRMRRRRARPEVVVDELEHGDGGGWERHAELRSELNAWAHALPQDELEVALLSRLDRLTHPEIADVMGCSERTVRRLLTRFDARVASIRDAESLREVAP